MEHIQQVIDELVAEIAKREEENLADKITVNRLLAKLGKPKFYALEGAAPTTAAPAVPPTKPIRRGQFAGEPAPATAARAYFKYIGKEAGGATVTEIHDALEQGGFSFNSTNTETRKTGLRVALNKDEKVVNLGNDTFALAEWYPGRPKARRAKNGKGEETADAGGREDQGGGDQATEESEPAAGSDENTAEDAE